MMKRNAVVVVVIAALCVLSNSHNVVDTFYHAAVVEYAGTYFSGPVSREKAVEVMGNNLQNYNSLMGEAAEIGAQIIIFPEDGLYGPSFSNRDMIYPYLEPLPSSAGVIPCDTPWDFPSSPVLVNASCMARTHHMYMVFNMGEVVNCSSSSDPDCPEDGRYQYNTDVAISNNGEFLAKYHKSHLYYEPQFNQPKIPSAVTFETDFGVTFGIIICFDGMFPLPQIKLYEENVHDLIWTMWWVNEPPLITATQTQQAHSLYFGGNLLASGIGMSAMQSGSGLWSRNTTITSTYNPTFTPKTTLLTGILPILSHNKEPVSSFSQPRGTQSNEENQEVSVENDIDVTLHSASMPSDAEIIHYVTFQATTALKGFLNVTAGPLTCYASFEVLHEAEGIETYGLLARYGKYNGLFHAQICALMKCNSSDTCGTYPQQETSTKFNSWRANITTVRAVLIIRISEVSAQYDASKENTIVFAMTAVDGNLIIPEDQFEVSQNFDTIESTILFDVQQPLLNAALFARCA